jgi:hypothetical protein
MRVNFADYYWAIGGSTTEVYSSATNTLVPVDDPAFVERGGEATPIASEGELADVLQKNRVELVPPWLFGAPSFIQPAPGTYDQDQLKAYSAYARWEKMGGGIVVNSIPFPTDPLTLGSLNAAFIYTSDKQVNAFSWKLPDGTFITLDTQGVKDLQNAVSKFGQDCFACEDATADKIDAGTVTDLPPIDAAYAAVSNVFTGLGVQRRSKSKKGR